MNKPARMRNPAYAITFATELYKTGGIGLRPIATILKDYFGVKVSHVSVWKWNRKFSRQMELTPQVSDRWLVDETQLNIGGKHCWLWAVLDYETRFVIAWVLSLDRGKHNAVEVFRKARNAAKKEPREIISDGYHGYWPSVKRVFNGRVRHIITDLYEGLNNRIERFFHTFKKRVKWMYRFGSALTAKGFIRDFMFWYNFVRRHSTLGCTPSQAAGLCKVAWCDVIFCTLLSCAQKWALT